MKHPRHAVAADLRAIAEAFQALRASQVLVYPAASLVVALLLTILLCLLLHSTSDGGTLPSTLGRRLLALVLFWVLLETISTLFAAALLNALWSRLEGGHPSPVACLSRALSQGRAILEYALVVAPVNALAFFVRPLSPVVRLGSNRLTRWRFGMDFDAMLMMALPPIALERAGCAEAFRRGRWLARAPRHDAADTRALNLGPVMVLLWVPALLIFSPPLLRRGPTPLDLALGTSGLVIGAVAIMCAQQLQALMSSVFGFAVYRDAVSGCTRVPINPMSVQEALRPLTAGGETTQ